MDKQYRRLLHPGLRVPFAALLVFSCITAFFNLYVALGELAASLVLVLILRRIADRRAKDALLAIDAAARQTDLASHDAAFYVPLPMAVIRADTARILWCNTPFAALDAARDVWFDVPITAVMPEIKLDWLTENRTEMDEDYTAGDRIYHVYGSLLKSADGPDLAALFFLDQTELVRQRTELNALRTVVVQMRLDNYEEVTRSLTGNERNYLLARIDEQITRWTDPAKGALIKTERDTWLFLCESRYLDRLVRFEVLQSIRGLTPEGIPPTLSIGLGKDGQNLAANLQYARLALDMALSRGGDQAVTKDPANYAFFGGRSREVEQRTRVRARVMAGALRDLILSADNILVMGHSYADMDALGACAGIACACRKLERDVRIVLNLQATAARPLYDRLVQTPEFRERFVSPEEAARMVTPGTLVIVADVNRKNYVDAPALLDLTSRVVVIDHHRKVADFIEHPILSLHEPYASSASELVCELLQYIVQPGDILRAEAEALLAGISLDTKNFTMKTGVRTFEAAAFLRRAGADTISVKQLFQNDMQDNILLCEILRTAVRYRDNMAIAACDHEVTRAIGGQAADELLNIAGVEASFVIFRTGGSTNVSARSLGKINVQIIMERLGGGGSITGAGAQLGDISAAAAGEKLRAAIENYFALV